MMNNNSKKYDANFTAGGILYQEFFSLREILQSNNFDELMKIEEEQNKFIQITTKSSRKRVISEIKRRYTIAPKDFWFHFFNWSETEQKLALFFLCLKTYPLVLDIHFEIAIKKFKIGSKLQPYDVQMRLDQIASFDDKVSQWSDLTLKKLNVQYRKAIKDVGLYSGTSLIRESKASTAFWDYFKNNNEAWFLEACFINLH